MQDAAVRFLPCLIAAVSTACAPSSPRGDEARPPSSSVAPAPVTPPPALAPVTPAETPAPTPPETTATSTPAPLSAGVLESATKQAEDVIRGRYMEKNCQPTSYPGWQGFPLQRCAYGAGGRKAEVILLDADASKPLKGWPESYDEHVKEEVVKATALLDIQASRMSELCPRWGELSRKDRIAFYADLLHAIAGAESIWDRTVMYNETGILGENGKQAVDPVTGQPVQSEGLLQLSYQDMLNYPPADGLSCTFDWNGDKAAFAADLAASGGKQSFKSTHPARSILDPRVQLTCGLHVLNTLAKANPTKSFPAFAGRYWSTMRPAGKGYALVLADLKRRRSACFASQ